MFDYLIFIGRFQPYHIGHQQVVQQALEQAKQVIVLIGSSRQPRSLRNPFTLDERVAMIQQSLTPEQQTRVHLQPLEDCLYNDSVWVKNVQEAVQSVLTRTHATADAKVGVIGHHKDHSSYYLQLFPQWGSVEVDNYRSISATPLREDFLLAGTVAEEFFAPAILDFLHRFKASADYDDLHHEALFIRKYKQGWSAAPYEPIFVTVDALVMQAGHILLVERKARPGQGLWALPGGFLDPQETILSACIRELREETRLKVPEPVLYGSLKGQQVFDEPHRSARGRTITHAFYFELKPDHSLPKVKGGDDAKSAFWVPLAEVQPERLFEDHYHIIRAMTGIY